jgi:hypothetical protein
MGFAQMARIPRQRAQQARQQPQRPQQQLQENGLQPQRANLLQANRVPQFDTQMHSISRDTANQITAQQTYKPRLEYHVV